MTEKKPLIESEKPSRPSKPETTRPAASSEPAPESNGESGGEFGGRGGLDPTRYGDWEKNGRCVDF